MTGKHPNGRLHKTRRPTLALSELIATQDFGELPHEFLLRICRGELIEHGTVIDPNTGEEVPAYVQPSFSERIDCAKYAAPFFAAKLSSVEILKGSNNDELDAVIAELATQAGLALGPPGEIEEADFTQEPIPRTTEASRPRRRVVVSDDEGSSVP